MVPGQGHRQPSIYGADGLSRASPDESEQNAVKNAVSTQVVSRPIDRRSLLTMTGAVAAASMLPTPTARASDAPLPALYTGNGEWTYKVADGWGSLPEGQIFGGTHGAIATDRAGLLYVSTQSETGILVYSAEGELLRTIAKQYPEVHCLAYSLEDGVEYLYATVQKGTPKENWLVVKMQTDGTVVQKITAPSEAGFATPNAWRITAAIPGPDGSIWIANGYGDSRIFRFDKAGNYKGSIGSKGKSEGQFDCSHGLAIDRRYDQPLLLVVDRENRRLCHFDLDGRFVRTITQHLRRPCQVSFYGDYAAVSELEGRATILDRDNAPVAFLGDNPNRAQWANYKVPLGQLPANNFSAAHGCFIDLRGNVYISDWNQTGRVTKLQRTAI